MTNYSYGKVRVKVVYSYCSNSFETEINRALEAIQNEGGIIEKIDTETPRTGCSQYVAIIVYVKVENNEQTKEQ